MGIASQTQVPKDCLQRRYLMNPPLPNAGLKDEG